MSEAPRIEVIGGRYKFRASAVGKCPVALLAEMYGFTPTPPPPFLAPAAKEGHLHEGAIIDDLETNGWIVHSRQETVEYWVDEDIFVRGHTDGVVSKGNGPKRILEVKSMSDNQWKEWLRSIENGLPTFSKHPAYAWQISNYMLATGMPSLYVVKNRNTGFREIYELDDPPRSGAEILARLRSVVDNYDPNLTLMQADPKCIACDPEVNQWFCPYPQFHDQKDKDAGLEFDDRPIIDAMAQAYQRVLNEEKRIKASKDEVRERLIELVGPSLIQTASGVKVKITKTEPRKRLNKDRAKSEGVDVDKYYDEPKNSKPTYRVTLED